MTPQDTPFPAWASNFYQWPLTFDFLNYGDAESAFQSAKTLSMPSRVVFTLEGGSPGPSKAKQMGRRLALRPDWDKIRDDVMFAVLKAKFAEPEMLPLLRDHDGRLVEWNTWHDNYWGICVCGRVRTCPGVGRNQLGKNLERLRRDLRIRDGLVLAERPA